jgi:hypothetical protein
MNKAPAPLPGKEAQARAEAKAAKIEGAASAKAARIRAKAPQTSASTQKAAFPAPATTVDERPAPESQSSKPKMPRPFDMLDLPDAMNRIGWPVASKLSRRWFNGRLHEIPKDLAYIYPADMVDTNTVSLDFVLKCRAAKAKYEKLIESEIYTPNAATLLRKRFSDLLSPSFVAGSSPYSGELDALARAGGDVQLLHKLFRFQSVLVSDFDTLDSSFGLTDLTASLANFYIVASMASARIINEKYFGYPKGEPMVYCCMPHIEVTHIYVCATDSYSFDDRGKPSQYLGHWNRTGVVVVPTSTNAPYSEDGFEQPVDILRGMFGQQMRAADVFFPVHNRDYSTWRTKHNRGGDFVIYTKPKKIKFPTPIKISLDEICRPYRK